MTADGAVKLVKVNIDENPEIAQQLRIQSIPTVYAFKNGQPVDGFMGALPESQVKAFVAAAGGRRRRHMAMAMAAPNMPPRCWRSPTRRWRPATSPRRPRPMAMCCRTSPAIPRRWRAWRAAISRAAIIERAKHHLAAGAARTAPQDEAIRAVEAELKLRETAAAPRGETAGAARQAGGRTPTTTRRAIDLALALDAGGDRDGAMAELLELVRRDRKWNEDAARKQLVTLFEAMGPTDPRTIEARRKLSGLLFS